MSLIQLPISQFNNIKRVLDLTHFIPTVNILGPNARKDIALIVCENILANNTKLDDNEKVSE